MAICGFTASISVDGVVTDGHRFSLTINSPESDVRTFSSDIYGDFIFCSEDGTITLNSREPIASLEVGDKPTSIVMTIGSTVLTLADSITTNITQDTDASTGAVVDWVYTFKVLEAVTGW